MILNQLSPSLIWNFLFDAAKVRFTTNPLLKPLAFSYYVTLRCNFKCSFCGFAQSGESVNELNTEKVIKLLMLIRESCSYIYFTGGEPLVRNDIVEILQAARQLRFKSVSVNTNLSLIHKRMEVLKYIDNLVVSINQMDDKKTASTKGISVRMAKQVRENLTTCLELREREKFSLTINCVVTRDSINDTPNVMEYCFQNNIAFAVVPAELEYGYLDKKLINDNGYKDLIRLITTYKTMGYPIFGSFPYLARILNTKNFTCYPTLIPHIYPNGDLFYPCQPMRQVAANILEIGSYKEALRVGIRKYGNIPSCRDRCFIACYIELSMAMKHPLKYSLSLLKHERRKNV